MTDSRTLEDTAEKMSEMLAYLRNLTEKSEITISKRPPIDTQKKGGMSLNEAAEWLGVDRDTFKARLMDTGIVLWRNIGTKKKASYIISTQSLNDFMTRRTR